MKHFIYIALVTVFTGSGFFLTSCCTGRTCDCFDDGDAAISIQFNVDTNSAHYWNKQDLIGTVLVVTNAGQRRDTIDRITSYAEYFGDYGFTIWNSFALNKDGVYTNPETYHIVNDSAGINIVVDQIVTKGNLSGECPNCRCYTNDYITYNVNGVAQYHKGQDRSGALFIVDKP